MQDALGWTRAISNYLEKEGRWEEERETEKDRKWILKKLLVIFFFKIFIYLFERESEIEQGKRQREMEGENSKQTPQ